MIWVRFVASRAEQKLGGKAEAMPHKVLPRRFKWGTKHNGPHRNFSVVRANNASTNPAIQKRAMIFDSCHPSASK